MKRSRVGLAALLLVIGTGQRTAAAPCASEVALEPAAPVVGEPIRYRLRVTLGELHSGVQWIDEPRFPGLRAEWLPGAASDDARELNRVLFAIEPGPYTLPAVRIRCLPRERAASEPALADPPAVPVEIAARRFEVAPIPDIAAAPEGFQGVVSSGLGLSLAAVRQSPLGRAIPVDLSVVGAGNLWLLTAPSPRATLAHGARVDVFEEAPIELERLVDPDGAPPALAFRRRFRWSLVPRETGELRIAPIEIVYFDPREGRFAKVSSEPLDVVVTPREPRPPPGPVR